MSSYSRGVDAANARALLTYAFVADVIDRMGIAPLRTALAAHLDARLPGAGELLAGVRGDSVL